jgi:hypothetical protein
MNWQSFVTAWRRFHALKQEIFPQATLTFVVNPNSVYNGGSQSGGRASGLRSRRACRHIPPLPTQTPQEHPLRRVRCPRSPDDRR